MSTELDTTYVEIVTRLAHVQARKAELETEETELKTKLAENLAHGSYTIGGKPAITITTGRRFDPNLALTILPPELATLCQATIIDSRLAKQVLPPTLYERCQRENQKTTVRVH